MKKILIVNVNWLGDVLFSTPFIQNLRNNYPDSYIACLLVPRTLEILQGNPAVNEIIIFDEKGKHKGLTGKLKLIKQLRLKKFDTVFLLHRSFTRTLIAFLSGIPERVGYYTKKRSFLLTRAIEPPEEEKHRVEYFLDILRKIGLKVDKLNYQFFISPADKAYANELLKKEGIKAGEDLIIINPGGNWLLKRWPKENFARLANALANRFQAKIIITGANTDIKLAQEISSLMKNKPIILCGKTNLKQLGAVLERAKLVISNDSGPMHLAAGLKIPLIALFGPTSPLITGPYTEVNCIILQKDIGCLIPCYNLSCPDNRCLKAVEIEEVVKTAEKLFKK